jgi:glycosyltransferase involved in cell wall biosynthesis
MTSPRVSIITATFNRSNVLSLAVRSVLWSAFENWELIVVGDCCTDDTAEVMASFPDERIRFVNLTANVGEQSGPNNAGFGLARGELIAYLNHDDLWYPDHLDVLVGEIDRDPSDLVFSMLEVIEADGTPTLSGASPTGRYEPYLAVPASSWLARRELIEELGGWRPSTRSFNVPSQDLLFRAWRKGRMMRHVPKVTGVAIPSGGRPGVYARRDVAENERWFASMAEPGFREAELTRIAHRAVALQVDIRVGPKVRRAVENLVRRCCLTIGVHPSAVRNAVRYGGRGGWIRHLRRARGLAD